MHHRVLRSLFVATTALLLTTTACDKGAEKKADDKTADKKTDDKAEAGAAEAGEAAAAEAGAAEAGEAVAAEAGAAEAGAAEAGAAEAGAAEAGEAAAAEAGEVAAEAGEAEAGAAEGGEAAPAEDKPEDKPEPKKSDDKIAAAPKVDGKPLFESKCKSCHGISGDSDTTIGKKLEIPALKGGKLSKGKIVSILNKGVPGTKMKSYKDKFSADEIEGIAAYVAKL